MLIPQQQNVLGSSQKPIPRRVLGSQVGFPKQGSQAKFPGYSLGLLHRVFSAEQPNHVMNQVYLYRISAINLNWPPSAPVSSKWLQKRFKSSHVGTRDHRNQTKRIVSHLQLRWQACASCWMKPARTGAAWAEDLEMNGFRTRWASTCFNCFWEGFWFLIISAAAWMIFTWFQVGFQLVQGDFKLTSGSPQFRSSKFRSVSCLSISTELPTNQTAGSASRQRCVSVESAEWAMRRAHLCAGMHAWSVHECAWLIFNFPCIFLRAHFRQGFRYTSNLDEVWLQQVHERKAGAFQSQREQPGATDWHR
jgi:hypothetical protein